MYAGCYQLTRAEVMRLIAYSGAFVISTAIFVVVSVAAHNIDYPAVYPRPPEPFYLLYSPVMMLIPAVYVLCVGVSIVLYYRSVRRNFAPGVTKTQDVG